MPFDIGETVNKLVDYLCNSTVAHFIISNPFIVALLLVAIVVSIFLAFFYNRIKGESTLSFVKLYIYSFLITAITLLLHYRCQEKDIEKSFGVNSGEILFESVRGAPAAPGETNVIGGTFTKVDPGCGCTGNMEGGAADESKHATSDQPASGQLAHQQQQTSQQPVAPVQTTIAGVANKTEGSLEKTTVNFSKIAIKPTTKSPFSNIRL